MSYPALTQTIFVCLADWTQIPGKEMLPGTGELAGSRVVTVTGSRMEFVINNTEGGWCAISVLRGICLATVIAVNFTP